MVSSSELESVKWIILGFASLQFSAVVNIPPLLPKINYIPGSPGENKIIADALLSRDAYRDVIF